VINIDELSLNYSRLATKNKLVKFLLANSRLFDKTLRSIVISPYKEASLLNRKAPEGAKSAIWCAEQHDLLLSKATELNDDVAFSELVAGLQLNGSLLAV
jgi:hypothetical protein